MIKVEKLEVLKKLQDDYDNITKILDTKHQEFMDKNKNIYDAKEYIQISINQVKEELKTQGLEEFAETGVKKLTWGLSIREMNECTYDEEIALKWALEHAMALKLDTTKFKKIAKIHELDFVTFKTNPIVCFPSVLNLENK